MDSLQERLEYWMKIRNTNPKRLSRDAGLHETYIRDVLKRTANPGLDKIAKICRALDIRPHDLVPEIRDFYPPDVLDYMEDFFALEEKKKAIRTAKADKE